VYEPYWVVIVVGYPIIGLGLSAFNYRIIHIRRISLTLYPNPHPHTIGFGLSTSAWISKTLLHIRIIRIRIGSDAEIIHTTFIPTRQRGGPRPSLLRCVAPPPMLLYRRLPRSSTWEEGPSAPFLFAYPSPPGSLSLSICESHMAPRGHGAAAPTSPWTRTSRAAASGMSGAHPPPRDQAAATVPDAATTCAILELGQRFGIGRGEWGGGGAIVGVEEEAQPRQGPSAAAGQGSSSPAEVVAAADLVPVEVGLFSHPPPR
jgi:hypothetical protein